MRRYVRKTGGGAVHLRVGVQYASRTTPTMLHLACNNDMRENNAEEVAGPATCRTCRKREGN